MRYALSNHSSSFHASPKYSQYLVQIRHPHVIWFVLAGCKRKTKKQEDNGRGTTGKRCNICLNLDYFCGKSILGGDKTVGAPTGAKKHKKKEKKGPKKVTKSDSRSVSKKQSK